MPGRRDGGGKAEIVVKKKKKKPLPVPSLTIDYQNPPPRMRPMQAVGPEPKKKPAAGGHLPTEYEYLSPSQFGERVLGVETAAEKREARRQNQWRERARRDAERAQKAAEKTAREERRAAVRRLDAKARKFIGQDKLREFIATGHGMEPSFGQMLESGIKGAAHAFANYDPRNLPGDIYDVGDWWINKAPEKALGEGGWADAWDAMSTEEQIDTIVGGKSLSNVFQGNLTPGNIGRAVALAAMIPFPFGKGLPSLATVLLRAGMSAEEVKIALTTGRGMRKAMQAAKTPVLTRVSARGKDVPRLVRALKPQDAKEMAGWSSDAARIGQEVLSHAKAGRMPTLALHDEAGNLRAVAAYVVQDDSLIVSQMAGAGKGGGTAMMKELAQEAADLSLGVRLTSESVESSAFYRKIGMTQEGKRGFSWTPKEAADFAAPGAAHIATGLMKADKGFTLDAGLSPISHDSGYMVAVGPYEQQIPAADFSPADIEAYRIAHQEHLGGDNFLGGYEDEGTVYLDIARKVEDKDEALRVAAQDGQLSVWDNAAGDEIRTGLTKEEADAIKAGPEAGRFSLGGFREKAPIRMLTSGSKVQQLPAARSAVTRALIERPADWTSTRLASEESKAAGLIRKALPTASAEARVAKAAGRQQIIESSRANARVLNYIHDLPDAGSTEDLAHFYWAQLPSAERNASGLQRVRDAQAAELEDITSGNALGQIESMIGAVKAQLAETDDLRLLRELEELKILATDIPHRMEDLSASIAALDKVIEKPPKLRPKVIEAVRALSEGRRAILIEAGVLDAERATNREGLFSRWLGLEPTGEEAYIGHRLGKVRGSQPSLMPVSPGVGRARVPVGTRQRNQLVLARTGRLRASTHVAAEDWRAAQTYHAALVARNDLSLMGKPFEGRLPEGYTLVNPKGRAIPPHWKTLPAFDELDDEEVRKAAKEIMDGFLTDADGADEMIEAAKAAGINWDELRIVPERVVKRYYGQFTPAGGATKIGKAYDAAIDFTAASIIFARVGYIPKNIAQNLIISVPHQGPFMLVNIPRAAEALIDPELRHFLHAEVGFSGATHEIGEELRYGKKLRGLPGRAASLVGKVADDPARFSAFIHEAAAAGVISKYSPHLTSQDKEALLRLFTDSTNRPLLNDIRSRSVESMADFSRLTPTQRRWARRFLIIPGWLWAGSRYPFHFAATHPGRSAAIAYVAAGEPYGDRIGLPQNRPFNEIMADNLSPFVKGINLPDGFPIFGGKTFRTTSLSPVSTPYEIALALGGQDTDTAASYANPLAKALWNMANQRVEYPGGSYRVGYQEAVIRNLERLLPNWTFIKQEIHPDGSGFYPEDESRLGRFFRELGVVPIKVVGETKKDEDEWVKEAERLSGGPVPQHVLDIRKADQTYNEEYNAYQKEQGITEGGLTPQERLVVLVRTQVALHPDRAAQGKAMEAQAMTMSDDEAEDAISEGREKMGLTEYGRIQDKLAKARVEARTHTGMVNGGQH